MIFKIISPRDVAKKLLIFVLLCLSFAVNLIIYNDNQEGINNYKPYYAESYIFAVQHKITELSNDSQAEAVKDARSIPVLVYHGVVPKSDGVSISIGDFKNQMFALKKQGYQTVRMDDFNEYIKGNKKLPDKSFLLTFDDGRKDSYYPVDPILAELNYSATMFVITDTMEVKSNRFHLIKPELEKMEASGRWDLEVHTDKGHGTVPVDDKGNTGHFYTSKMWLKDQNRLETNEEFTNRIKADLLNAKTKINTEYNTHAIALAFPYGDYGVDSVNFPEAKNILLSESGKIFPLLFYQTDEEKGFSFNVFGKDSQMIKRINVQTNWSAGDLEKLFDKSKEKDINQNFKNFNFDQGWIKNWGSVNIRDGKLYLDANEETKGASVFLDGTSSWRNYEYLADINTSGTDSISMLMDYKNDANYTYFTYNSGNISLQKKENNIDTVLATGKTSINFDNQNILLGVRVKDGLITCLINNKEVLSSVKDAGTYGGIGLVVWNDQVNTAGMSVNQVKVQGL